ncbi:CvfB family protein [Litoribacillus peritrichatus]|uniref:S1-like domain-containing RNA-binding protein n=1 Tax=Litoribacillus peritrichatus TaxID=718191 RepID=A0ABP7N274_9GAMM
MATIGRRNTLEVVKIVDFGVYLDGEQLDEILLPKRYVPKDCAVGDMVDVFIYLDSDDKLIATTLNPKAMLNEVAKLKVVSVNEVGAFLDWGLPKDLLVPFGEQHVKMEEGRSYNVYIYQHQETHRIAASSKLNRFVGKTEADYRSGDPVELFVTDRTDIGYSAVINNAHWGVLFEEDLYRPLRKGQKINGYIKRVREDGKIDLSLQKVGYQKVDDLSRRVMNVLRAEGGYLALSDKSPAQAIHDKFGVSKNAYKMTIGALYKQRKITIDREGIKLID